MSHVAERLSDWMDDALSPAERGSVEAHLARCEACRRTLADLQAIVDAAAGLPPRQPAQDLWPNVRDRLTRRVASPESGTAAQVVPLRRRRIRLSVVQAAAASLAMATLGAGAAWVARGPAPRTERVAAVPVLGPAVALPTEARVVSDAARSPELAKELAELEAVLAGAEDFLAPETLRVLRRNLDLIDRAIAESQAALAADPADPYLQEHLEATLRRKARYLQETLVVSS
ncbi:MAG: zf-HC2 domain-containing protein [Gemmatimonadota bacterium]